MSYQNPYLNPYGFANYGQYMPRLIVAILILLNNSLN